MVDFPKRLYWTDWLRMTEGIRLSQYIIQGTVTGLAVIGPMPETGAFLVERFDKEKTFKRGGRAFYSRLHGVGGCNVAGVAMQVAEKKWEQTYCHERPQPFSGFGNWRDPGQPQRPRYYEPGDEPDPSIWPAYDEPSSAWRPVGEKANAAAHAEVEELLKEALKGRYRGGL